MSLIARGVLSIVLASLVAFPAGAQTRSDTPSTPRIYIFDNGRLEVRDPRSFGFTRAELAESSLILTSYLIVHPKGALMFDAGGIPDADFRGDGTPVTLDNMSASQPLLPQLATIGYTPAEVTYFALSHYHADHTANANAFAGSTWIVQRAEREAMFGENPQDIIRPEYFSALRNAGTRILDNEDLDVFGDGTVVVKAAPGHTPGHQVLLVRPANHGPVLLAGDLYHYPEERLTDRYPTFEFDVPRSRASRRMVEALLEETGAQLWIEHDIATHAALPIAPAYVD